MNKIIKRAFALLAGALISLPGVCRSQENARLGGGKASSPAPEWMNSAVIYEANLRQGTPTRDFRGLEREIPRLKDLGVDIIWLMPIHPISEDGRKGSLGSYYAVKDYKAVNPEFGTIGDLKSLVAAAHAHGMKVILDEVCNHTGRDNAWVTEHPEYYARDRKGQMYGPYDWTDVYVLDYTKKGTRKAMTDALKFWIEECDIDGYRCDVAGEVDTGFWEEVRPQLQKIKPVFMLAEASKPELLLKAFDADYAWPMKDVFNAIAATQGVNRYAAEHDIKYPRTGALDIIELLKKQLSEYPKGSVHMNMVTNHDLNSWEGTEFDRYGPAMKTFAVLSYTLPGMPMMYTGQEVGFNHPFEFFERDSVQPDYKPNKITEFYRALNALKHHSRALDAHTPIESMDIFETTNPNILAFSRTSGKDRVLVICNLSNEKAMVKYRSRMPDAKGLRNWFSGAPATLPTGLAPWEFLVFSN